MPAWLVYANARQKKNTVAPPRVAVRVIVFSGTVQPIRSRYTLPDSVCKTRRVLVVLAPLNVSVHLVRYTWLGKPTLCWANEDVVLSGLPELQISGWTSEVRPNKTRILNPTQHGGCWRGHNRAERHVLARVPAKHLPAERQLRLTLNAYQCGDYSKKNPPDTIEIDTRLGRLIYDTGKPHPHKNERDLSLARIRGKWPPNE